MFRLYDREQTGIRKLPGTFPLEMTVLRKETLNRVFHGWNVKETSLCSHPAATLAVRAIPAAAGPKPVWSGQLQRIQQVSCLTPYTLHSHSQTRFSWGLSTRLCYAKIQQFWPLAWVCFTQSSTCSSALPLHTQLPAPCSLADGNAQSNSTFG